MSGTFNRDVALAALTSGVRFCVLDVETTTSETGNRIVSVGIVQVDGHGSELARPIYWLCNPGCAIETAYIHSITDDDVANEQPFSVHLEELDALLTPSIDEQVVLVCHTGFDVGVLLLEHRRAGRPLADVPVLDTRQLARHLEIPVGSLFELLAHFDYSMTNAHNALADAKDTAVLLRHLLEEAARSGAAELEALLAAAQGERLRTIDYAAHAEARGTLARKRSPFIFIERPQSHRKTHKRLPHNPSQAQFSDWIDGLRECITLRCPLLLARVLELRSRRVRPERAQILEVLMQELEARVAAGDRVGVNTILSVLGETLRGCVYTTEVGAFYDRVVSIVGPDTPRCDVGASVPFDSCPECRAARACAADVWWQPFAVALAGLHLSAQHVGSWMGDNGKLTKQVAAGRTELAAHAAWLLVNVAERERSGDAAALAALAAELGLVEPRLILYRARRLSEAGELEQAEEVARSGLAIRDGSTDLAWREIDRFRAGVAAHQEALRRVKPERAFLFGRSAPAQRPQRRRFTNTRASVSRSAPNGSIKV
jgi:DNA polymerase III epsilon subunit-like protein